MEYCANTNTAATTLSAIQAANQSTFISTLTPLEISRKDKNKQLTLLSQLNSHKPQEIHFLHYKIIGEPKKCLTNGPVLYLDLKQTIHVITVQIHLVRQSL